MTTSGWRWPVYLAYQREEWTQWRRALLMLLPAVIVVLAVGLLAGVHPATWVPATACLLLFAGGALSELFMWRRFGLARAFMARSATEYQAWRRRIGLPKAQAPMATERLLAAEGVDVHSEDRALLHLSLGQLHEARAEAEQLPRETPRQRYVGRRLALLLGIAGGTAGEADLRGVRDAIAALEDPREWAFALSDLVLVEACVDIVTGADWIARMRRAAEEANERLRANGHQTLRDRPFLMALLVVTAVAMAGLMLLVLISSFA